MSEPVAPRNKWLWTGFLLALLTFASNFAFFVSVPGQRVISWLMWPLAIASVVCLIVGLKGAFQRPPLYRGKILASILAVVSVLLIAVCAFGFISARSLPKTDRAPQVGQKVPDFTLPDTSGQPVSLSQLLAAKPGGTHAVLLIFYRGYW
jgi:hypothetical protein